MAVILTFSFKLLLSIFTSRVAELLLLNRLLSLVCVNVLLKLIIRTIRKQATLSLNILDSLNPSFVYKEMRFLATSDNFIRANNGLEMVQSSLYSYNDLTFDAKRFEKSLTCMQSDSTTYM